MATNLPLSIDNMINEHLLGLGTKSPVQLSPGQECDMSVQIATRNAKENKLNNLSGPAPNLNNSKINRENLTPKQENDKNVAKSNSKYASSENGGQRKAFRRMPDVEYDILMNEIARIKNNIQQDVS